MCSDPGQAGAFSEAGPSDVVAAALLVGWLAPLRRAQLGLTRHAARDWNERVTMPAHFFRSASRTDANQPESWE